MFELFRPDELGHGDRRLTILASIVPLALLSTFFAFTHFFVKAWSLRYYHLDDTLILLSVLATWVAMGISVAAIYKGHGQHATLLKDEDKLSILRLSILAFSWGILALALPKLAITCLMARLLNPPNHHRLLLWALVSFCIVALVGNELGIWTSCSLPKGSGLVSGNLSFVAGSCIRSAHAIHYASASSAVSAATNLCLAAYALVAARRLALQGKKRFAVGIAVGLGFVGTVMAGYKSTRLKALRSTDFSYDTAYLYIWTFVDSTTTIVAACIPVLRPLFDLCVGRNGRINANKFDVLEKDDSGMWQRPKLFHNSTSRHRSGMDTTHCDTDSMERGKSTESISTIEIEHHVEFQVKYEYTTSQSDNKGSFRIVKNQGADGLYTTTVEVCNDAREGPKDASLR